MRSQEISVLLVEPRSVPQHVTRLFNARHCWVETVELVHLAPALVAAAPQVVVCRDSHLEKVLCALKVIRQHVEARVIVILEPGAEDLSRPELAEQVWDVLVYESSEEELRRTIWAHLAPQRHRCSEATGEEFQVAPTVRPPPLPGEHFVRPSLPTPPLAMPSMPLPAVEEPSSAPQPRRVRVEVGGCAELPNLRIVLREGEDEGWTAGVERSLRDAGHTVTVANEPTSLTSWHALRRLSPHGVLMSELAPCVDGGEWLEALRSDPFLSSTPVAMLGRRPTGMDDWLLSDALKAFSEFEGVLKQHLFPGQEVCFDLCQLGVASLLRLLAEQSVHAQLSAGAAGQVLRWGFRGGSATAGLLETGQRHRLEAEQALEWLLAHPRSRVALRIVRSLNVRPGPSIAALLSESMRTVSLPLRRVSGVQRREQSIEASQSVPLLQYRERQGAMRPWLENKYS